MICKECKEEMWYHGGNWFCFNCQKLVTGFKKSGAPWKNE